MYTSTHTATAGIILLTVQNIWIAGILAFFSHLLIDVFGEKPYPNKTVTFISEGLFCLFCALTFYLSGRLFVALLLAVVANAMDIIDKFRVYFLAKWQIFPCHQKWYWKIYLPSWKWNINIPLTIMIIRGIIWRT